MQFEIQILVWAPLLLFGLAAGCSTLVGPTDAADIAAPQDTTADPTDAADIASPQDSHRIENCLEIYRGTEPQYPDQDGSFGGGPTILLHLGNVPVGASTLASIRYYNVCRELMDLVLGTELIGEDGGAADPGFTLEESPAPGTSINANPALGLFVRVRFLPSATGVQQAVARYRLTSGTFESHFSANGVSP